MADTVAQKCESDTKGSKSKAPYGPLDPGKMMHTDEVLWRTGWSRSTLWRRVRAGKYPPPMDIGPNLNGWLGKWHKDWFDARPRRDYGAEAPYEFNHADHSETPDAQAAEE